MTKTIRLHKLRCLLITTGVGLGLGASAGCGGPRSLGCEAGPGCETGESGSATSADAGTEGTEGSGDSSGDGATEGSSGEDSATDTDGATDEGGALCGNGVIDEGEDCDDGNSGSGDTCLADCQFPGALLGEKVFGFDKDGIETSDEAREVVHVTEASVHVLGQEGVQWRVVQVDTESLEVSAEYTELEVGHRLTAKNLAWGFRKVSMLGGYDDPQNKGLVQFFEADGSLGQTLIYEPKGNGIGGVRFRAAISDLFGNVIAAGSYGDGAIIARIAIPENQFINWELAAEGEIEFGPIAVGNDYIIRAWEKSGALWLIEQSDGTVIDTTIIPTNGAPSDASIFLNLSSDNALYISISHDAERRIVKVDDYGSLLWSKPWIDELETFAGAATLPSDGVIIAGEKEDHGALLWVSSEGDAWSAINDLTPEFSSADSAKLDDVAISPSGAHGIAVGSVKLAGSSNSDLWIRKFEI